MSKGLDEIDKEYERILHSDKNRVQKDRAFAASMMGKTLWDGEFEKKNRAVIALYRKISKS